MLTQVALSFVMQNGSSGTKQWLVGATACAFTALQPAYRPLLTISIRHASLVQCEVELGLTMTYSPIYIDLYRCTHNNIIYLHFCTDSERDFTLRYYA